MRPLFYLVVISLILHSGCIGGANERSSSEPQFDTQYLPEGVSVPEHKIYVPDGSNFQGARIDPPFWWTQMEHDTLQLLIYDEEIAGADVVIRNPGVEVIDVSSLRNPNYLFVTLRILPDARTGKFPIQLQAAGKVFKSYLYELKRRISIPGRIEKVTSSDLMYLIMPDRFANGDPTNDSYDDMLQTGVDRSKMYFRHGGDIQGVIDNLSYLQDLSVSALWMTPVLENNQPYASYHGYAITDHYAIDRRFGSLDDYISLGSKCQTNGIKLIKDMVFNHVGHMHWFIQDLPSADWIHQFAEFTRSNHSSPALRDPYSSLYDRTRMLNGWFDYSMPDLNQQNPFLAEYLIQNAIWWIEQVGIDAFRLDTYQYCDQDFMKEMGRRVRKEYPDFFYFGETNVESPALQSSFAANGPVSEDDVVMPSVCDFGLNRAIKEAVSAEPGWHQGVYQLYYAMADDLLYEDPSMNVTFLDNHDMDRIFATVDYEPEKLKSAISLLLTLRGIPCVYYGTELGFRYKTDPDGKVRPDMPGGWEGDTKNVFEYAGLNELEGEIYYHFKTLAAYRKASGALRYGETTQYAPENMNGIYAFFRTTETETVMIVFNSATDPQSISTLPYAERLGDIRTAQDIFTGEVVSVADSLVVPGHTTLVLQPVRDVIQ